MNIFLDDKRVPNMSHNNGKGLGASYSDESRWVIARDYFEFVDIIDKYFDEVKLVSFDHDLACFRNGDEYTGKTAADYLINYCIDNNKKFPDWYVHTDNVSGRSNIIGAITNYLKVIEGVNLSNFRYYNNGIVNGKLV